MTRVIFGYFAGTLAIAGILLNPNPSYSQSASSKAAPPAVLVAKIRTEEIGEQFSYFGRVEATDRVQIRARIDGYLGPLAFEQGSFVQKGDLLFEIEKKFMQRMLPWPRPTLPIPELLQNWQKLIWKGLRNCGVEMMCRKPSSMKI